MNKNKSENVVIVYADAVPMGYLKHVVIVNANK